jgi:putative DNA primase/helicase
MASELPDRIKHLVEKGLCVIPLKPGTKQAAVIWKAFQARKPTDQELAEWFGGPDPADAAIVLGPISGVVVIDPDDREQLDAVRAEGLASPSYVRTGSGNFHFYFADEGGHLPAFIHPRGVRVELKRQGHYVVAPGSRHPETGSPYEMFGPWPPPPLPSKIVTMIDAGRATATDRKPPLPGEIPDGGRNNVLFTEACRMRGMGWELDEILPALRAINKKRVAPPKPEREVETIARSACRYPAGERREFPLSEQGDAECFAAAFGDRLHYHHRDRVWLVFNGVTWQRDPDGELQRMAVETMRERQVAALRIQDKDERKRALDHYVGGESVRRVENMLKAARSVRPLADAGDGWDDDPWLLGAQNGVVDLRTGTLRDGRPEDRITRQVAVGFDPDAKCPTWEETLRQIFEPTPEALPFVRRALGYSLTGLTTEECLFFANGDGRNGKGTLMNTFSWLMGGYADNLSFSALESMRDKGRGATPELAKLPGIRFLTSAETDESAVLNTARIKSVTGRDPVTCRPLYMPEFTFMPMFKLWLAANDLPQVADDSEGFWARLKMIPFLRSFAGREDRTLKDKLREEGPGILAWAVRACLEWQRHGLGVPAVVEDATRDYRRESDAVGMFFAERVEDTSNERDALSMGALYRVFCDWFDGKGLARFRRPSVKKFSKAVRRMLLDRVDDPKSRNIKVRGVRLIQVVTEPVGEL